MPARPHKHMPRIRRHRPLERLLPLDIQPRRHVGAGILGWQRGTCGDGGGWGLQVEGGLAGPVAYVGGEEAAGGDDVVVVVVVVVCGEADGGGGGGGGVGHGGMVRNGVGLGWVGVRAWV